MNILNKKLKLDLLTDKKQTTHEFYKKVSIRKNWVTVTNGYAILQVPTKEIFNQSFIDSIPDKGIIIDASVWKELLKFDKIVYIDANEPSIELSNSTSIINFKVETNINYPTEESLNEFFVDTFENNIKKEVDQIVKNESLTKEEIINKLTELTSQYSFVQMNAKYIDLIKKATCFDKFRFQVTKPNGAIHIKFINAESEARAIIMPIVA